MMQHRQHAKLVVFGEGILVGILAGLITVLYRVLLQTVEGWRKGIYGEILKGNGILAFLWFLCLILIAIALGKLVTKLPMIKGSGIPQVKGVLIHQFTMNWWKELISKFFGGVAAIGMGFSLGREGPSVQMGAHVGLGIGRILKRPNIERKYLLTAGASAGLSAAFNAPFAGMIFALEELHKNFSPLLLTCVMSSSLAANFVSSHFLGVKPSFDFHKVLPMPLQDYWVLIGLGVVAGILGKAFNVCIVNSSRWYKIIPEKYAVLRPVFPAILAGILGIMLPEVLGGGHPLVESLNIYSVSVIVLLVILVVKFAFTVICYGSGVPGGIFLPMLVIGAVIGKIYGVFSIKFFGISDVYTLNFMILAMAAYFTAVTRAPITGSILITEMTGSFDHLLSLIMVSMVAFIVTDLLNSKAIYDVLLENMMRAVGKERFVGDGSKKILLEIPVSIGSTLENCLVKHMEWPQNCLIVGLIRGEAEIIPNGDTTIYAGDTLLILTDEDRALDIKPDLLEMGAEAL
ncbi:ClC family H(+)/Cl(-) exchange transporter [Petroclostridium sp. X23]|nr:ClC family H(+)/Cl(-) exchange transporter [Petroclostridium sp. X23]WHH61769.1 ClC family H(+)/Cl(-) exchange transporter [Petroclostridium sp. X23]